MPDVGRDDIPVLTAPPAWRTVDFIADLHLQEAEPATFAAWRDYLRTTTADAVFVLGDLFEAWPGDDAIGPPGFAADCAHALREAAARRPLFFLHGNRDFLVGPALADATGVSLMDDPTALAFGGQRWLLTHGDALCIDDAQYQRFRAQVRSPQWQAQVLARPLAERQALARQMRDASQARHAVTTDYADVDAALARQWLARAGATVMIHGHTHRPAEHALGDGLRRIVLSDWDLEATPPRAQALRLSRAGQFERIDLA